MYVYIYSYCKLIDPNSKTYSLVLCRFLPQAGDGADYLEGYKDPYHVCFKCGRAGHWAQQCPGLLPNGQVSHMSCW